MDFFLIVIASALGCIITSIIWVFFNAERFRRKDERIRGLLSTVRIKEAVIESTKRELSKLDNKLDTLRGKKEKKTFLVSMGEIGNSTKIEIKADEVRIACDYDSVDFILNGRTVAGCNNILYWKEKDE